MRIEVVPCNNDLGAQLRFHAFTPEEWRAEFGGSESLQSLLFQAGIAKEFIDKPSLQLLHEMLGSATKEDLADVLEEAQSIVVASGVPPMDDEVVGLRLLKAYLTSDDELNSLRSRLARESYQAITKTINPGCLVEKGSMILGFTAIKKGSPGVGVFGKTIPPNPYGSSLPKPGNSILEEENKWVALKQGVLVVEENTFKILGPKGPDDNCLLISPDKMSVRLFLRIDESDDSKPTLGFLQQYIADQHFAFSPAMDKVQSALAAFNATGKNQNLVILTGKPKAAGRNGKLELLIDPEPHLPEPDAEGRIDFKSFCYFRAVNKGTPLAKVIAPMPGMVGMDVFGNPLLPEEVSKFDSSLGKNTELTHTDPSFIVASCDGRLLVENGVPQVVDTLQIKDDISLKTGNIDFPGSIEVTGDVRDNFEIKAKGDVDISGMVEDGCITSEGSIVVKGGFTGTGKGVIKSKLSSVSIGFIRNQRIESHSDIIVYNEVINAYLCAKKTISMKSLGNSVVGGHLIAYSGIKIFNAGSQTGAKTILEVGKDFEVEMELNKKKLALKEIQSDIDFLEKMAVKLQGLVHWGSDAKGDIRLLEQRTRGVLQFLKPIKETLANQLRDLEGKLYNPGDCYIWVLGEAFPGTILRYQDRNILINEINRGKRWLFRGKASEGSRKDPGFTEFD